MNITSIQIRKTFRTGPIRAIVSIVIDNALAIHDIKVIQTDKLFMGMPNKIDENGFFRDTVHPINSEARHYIENQILAAYIEYIENNSETITNNTTNNEAQPVCSETSGRSQITQSASISETKSPTTETSTEKRELKKSGILSVNNNVFKIAHVIPSGYTIWNIGTKMPSGYLPICRFKQQQPFDGAREIIKTSLIAVTLPEAQLILNLVSHGINTIDKMQIYVKRYENRAKSEDVKARIAQCKAAVDILQKIPGAEGLIE